MSCFSYKGFQGSIEASLEDRCLYGKIMHISDLILYEGKTLEELENGFKASVDDYLAHCKESAREPNKPFKGSFNVRIGRELHEKAARRAGETGKTLNDYIKDIIRKDMESHV